LYKDDHNKSQKQNKVQGIYRRIKHQDKEDKNENKIWAVIVSICFIIMFLLLVIDAMFDSGVWGWVKQHWGK